MKAFIGLLKKEQLRYLNSGLFVFFLGVLAIWIVPLLIKQKFPDSLIDESRFFTIIVVSVILTTWCIFSFMGSVRRDIKLKELWLHNHQSMSKLIFAKFLYQGLQLFVFSVVIFIGIFFVRNEIVGTFGQIYLFYCVCIYYVMIAYFLIGLFGFLTITVEMQLKLYLKRWSGPLTIIVIFVFLRVINLLPEQIVPYWRISSRIMKEELPQFKNAASYMTFDFFLAEDLLTIAVFIILYLVVCKWLERVLVR